MVAGWDIGGANLKQAAGDGRAWSVPFELWRRPDDLATELARLLSLIAGRVESIAVTMTGELADCFATKSEGVGRILAAVENAAAGRPVSVWSTEGRFLSMTEARAAPLSVAAANWHALATWCGGFAAFESNDRSERSKGALLIDIGSTTTDIIPLCEGRPCPRGVTDVGRLQAGELVYTGVRRTPLCALLDAVRWRHVETPVAREVFATMLDAYLLLGDIPADETDCQTANGRPATIACAHDRLARMLCCDRDELPFGDAVDVARQWAAAQQALIAERVTAVWSRLPSPGAFVVLSGSGEFLGRRVLEGLVDLPRVACFSLAERLGTSLSEAACAYAVAELRVARR